MAVTMFKVWLLTVVVSAVNFGALSNDLGPELSQQAAIYLLGTQGFEDAKTRWAANINPGFEAIVKVATEQDVQATVS